MDTVIEQHNRAIEKFKGIDGSELGEQWAFKTIFQKAVVRLARILFITSPADQRDKLGTVDDYLNFLNKLHTSGVFRVHANLGSSKHGLWVFLAVTYGGKKIKVSASTEARIFNLLSLWYYGVRYVADQNKVVAKISSDTAVAPKDVLRYLGSSSAQLKWPKAKEHVDDLLKVFGTSANASVIAGEDLSDEEKIAKVARARLDAVFSAGLAAAFGVSLPS